MKRILLLFPLLITTVLIISLNIILYPKTHFDALKFNIEMNGNTQTISCWLNKEDNNYYVFLPSYTDLEYISVLTEMDVKLNDTIYKNNETLHNISPDVKYDISLLNRNGKVVENGNLIFLKTRNIPSMFIETISGDISKIHKNKNYRESGNVQIISPDGTIECHDDLKYIKGRGNFTWNSEKKPYNIEFTQPVEIFDIGTGKSWCLLANAFDASNIRNKIVFDFSKNIGLISPGSTFVDLYINNNYMGLYLLTQKAESISPSSSYLFELTPENRIDDSELIIKTDIGKNYTISSMQKNITQEKYNFY